MIRKTSSAPVSGRRSISAGTSITANAKTREARSVMAGMDKLTPEQRNFARQLRSNIVRGTQGSVMAATNTSNIMAKPDFLELLPLFVQKLLVTDVFGSIAMRSRQQLVPFFKVVAENDKGQTKAGDILNSPFVNRQGIDPNFTGRIVKGEIIGEGEYDAMFAAYTPILPNSATVSVVEAGVGEVPVDAVSLHELPHERFGRLDPRGGLRGGGAPDAGGLESIDDALAERGLGADERELDVVRLGELHDLGDVLLVAQEMALGPGEDAGVGVLHDAVQLGAGPVERLHGGVLPSSASDGEYSHIATSELEGGEDLVQALVLLHAALEDVLDAAGELVVVPGDDLRVDVNGVGDVHLVEDGHVGVDDDVVVLPDHVVALGDGHDDDPQVGAEGEVRGADEVAHVLDEEHVVVVQVDVGQRLLDEVGVEVALVAGVAVHRLESGLLEPGVVVVSGDVAGDGADADALGPELLGELDDERGLAGAYGAHEVDGLDVVLLQQTVVLMGDLVVLFQNIDLGAGLDYVHGAGNPLHTLNSLRVTKVLICVNIVVAGSGTVPIEISETPSM